MKFKTVAIGGTFDRLHKGHRYFISQAFRYGNRVIIGLTSDNFALKKRDLRFKSRLSGIPQAAGIYDLRINNFEERKKELEEFLNEKNYLTRAEIVEINDIYGPTLKDIDIDAIVVTKDSRAGGEAINRKRTKLKLRALEIIEVDLISAEDDKTISSTRIRLGEIDRWGKVFARLDIFGKKIATDLRIELKKPLGELKERITNYELRIMNKNKVCVIAVGDEITKFLNDSGNQADISIIDFYIKRIKVHDNIDDLGFKDKYRLINAKNPAGYITDQTVFAVKQAIEGYVKDGNKRVIKIEGEEDLAALPSILLGPLGTVVLYGQPDRGVVKVEVTEEKKKEILRLIHPS